MKKQIKIIALMITLSGVAALNVKVALATRSTYDLTMSRIGVLDKSREGSIDNDETPSGGGITEKKECAKIGGYWNMALTCPDGGVTEIKCEVNGKIIIFGMTYEGGFKKGSKYIVAWERWSCTSSNENCCNPAAQGIKVAKVSLK